ncbi:MAG: tRNA pseudouridine(55) synthase TruB [Oscillospiraceae bacterium]|nr:tRNA pseudouridine(55) synthase TruB [Oscillospiraceae bacterium]
MHGIICVYKPQGYTSFDIIAIMRRLLNTKKIGHSGTLDPMAEGVLPTFVGTATKAVDFCQIHDKEYRAAFKLGITTDTEDITGSILTEISPTSFCVGKKTLQSIAMRYMGEIEQIPPMYSAVKVGGKKLYELARKGVKPENIERKSRRVTIHSLEIESYCSETNLGIMRVSCSKGTYIRTLIHDIGRELGLGATMTALQRTSSNGFSLECCHTLKTLRDEFEVGGSSALSKFLLPLENFFDYPKAMLDVHQTEMFKNGVVLNADYIRMEKIYDGVYAVYDAIGRIIALARIEKQSRSFSILQRFNYGN